MQIVQGNVNIAIKFGIYVFIFVLGTLVFLKLLLIYDILPLIKHFFDVNLTW